MNGPLPRVPARVESPLRPPRDLRAVALACAFAGALLAARFAWTGGLGFAFLLWNLALALAPLALALPARGGAPRFVAWLLFFPNAPYLVTDFVHLGAGDAPLWFDVGLLAAFAWAGLLAGCVSLERMRGRVEGPGARGPAGSSRPGPPASRASASGSAASCA
ncbi:MAG TPA: DUF1361 domain-containing protein [Polyangiaceae bacterium LLY-WYZ-15_(1-7)]|nr:hypothetical protein [Sandaracinus sp.]HJL05106.1 DUF1361 domain-containing protein [Polyangiaceae bacterium LLY-WYZ-15_(1-7)]HJL11638.1 DUF1361 domain-containing protein [Polyangiaceae bacterium LLY-WYZ-15_(1-7)]HJL31111.1 DUF1361 domain-containing protein [Polyangiaceae bacterium LLY-WYZ-15_(1-7)]HJL38787.1 DUF1361 domain-containing protein [Polyangiaceae bacterium LLY-WYZ-15_(1-7)]